MLFLALTHLVLLGRTETFVSSPSEEAVSQAPTQTATVQTDGAGAKDGEASAELVREQEDAQVKAALKIQSLQRFGLCLPYTVRERCVRGVHDAHTRGWQLTNPKL